MMGHLSARTIRYAALGVVSCILTIVGLQTLVPRSATLQNMLHISKSGGGAYADSGSACVVAKKDLKDEVFFVSCGGFF